MINKESPYITKEEIVWYGSGQNESNIGKSQHLYKQITV